MLEGNPITCGLVWRLGQGLVIYPQRAGESHVYSGTLSGSPDTFLKEGRVL